MPEVKFPYKANTQTENSYGFGVLSTGIDLTRYKKNPIVLKNHNDNCPVGTAEDLNFAGNEASVMIVIDDADDADLQKIVRDIKKKLYQGLSMGIDPDFSSIKYGVEGFPPELPVITKSELLELSITPVPSNEDCLRFSHKGQVLTPKEVKIKLSANSNSQQISMNKLLLAMIPLMGLSAASTEEEVIAKLKDFNFDKEELVKLRAEKTAWTKAQADMQLSRNTELVDSAITAKKILPTQKEDFLKLCAADYDAAKRTLEAMPAKVSLSAKTSAAGAGTVDPIEGKTFKQLQKENPKALIELKATDREKYNALFNAESWNK